MNHFSDHLKPMKCVCKIDNHIMCEVCLITPPVGLNCYVVSAVRPDIPLGDVFRGIFPFFLMDALTVGLFLAYPELVLWLPNLVNS